MNLKKSKLFLYVLYLINFIAITNAMEMDDFYYPKRFNISFVNDRYLPLGLKITDKNQKNIKDELLNQKQAGIPIMIYPGQFPIGIVVDELHNRLFLGQLKSSEIIKGINLQLPENFVGLINIIATIQPQEIHLNAEAQNNEGVTMARGAAIIPLGIFYGQQVPIRSIAQPRSTTPPGVSEPYKREQIRPELLKPEPVASKTFAEILVESIRNNVPVSDLKKAFSDPRVTVDFLNSYRGAYNDSLLHMAVIVANRNAVEELLKFPINVNPVNNANLTPVDTAIRLGRRIHEKAAQYAEIQKLLQARGGRATMGEAVQTPVSAPFAPEIYQKLGVRIGAAAHEVLGLPQNPSREAVRKAYKRLTIKWHPDRNQDPLAGEIFKLISQANEELDG